jgi:dTDP-L-rhamnose 4-epimerase
LVRVFDSLEPQVHGPQRGRPSYLHPDVELRVADIRNPEAVSQALQGVDAVVHLASAVGVGQSMYEVTRYTSINNMGTAILLERLLRYPVARLIVASSMSIYGEGAYRGPDGTLVPVLQRPLAQLQAGRWEIESEDGTPLEPLPTPESKLPFPTSVYALSKYDQERLCLMIGEAYAIPTVALRFFNVYGPRQALSNPYTGVLAIFAARYLSRQAPMIFEDGNQQRDFVNVHDVARACRLALTAPQAAGQIFNIGSGRSITIQAVARQMAEVLERSDLPPEICRKYRVGDIRHCFADISRARKQLGYEPQVSFRDGLLELAEWLGGQSVLDRTARASDELVSRGLVV